jgi:hypothetical protein
MWLGVVSILLNMRATSIEMIYSSPYESNEAILRQFPRLYQHLRAFDRPSELMLAPPPEECMDTRVH